MDKCVHVMALSVLADGSGYGGRSDFSMPWTSVLNSFILLVSCGSELSHQYFRFGSSSDLTWVSSLHCSIGRTNTSTIQLTRLDLQCSGHWFGMCCVKKK